MLTPIDLFYLALFMGYLAMVWRIVRRAGYPGWWVLTQMVPGLNLAMIYIFAFSDWPVLREQTDTPTPA